jgi:hypothetical protein
MGGATLKPKTKIDRIVWFCQGPITPKESKMSDDLYAFNRKNVDNAPTEAGVYVLYKSDDLIYVGRAQGGSVTIRSRLQDHFSGREGACTKAATQYRRETTANAAQREIEWLTWYKEKTGKLPSCNERVG